MVLFIVYSSSVYLFIQSILKLNLFSLSRFAPTYETGTTRLFWHGRTETLRTCTTEVAEFCKAMGRDDISVNAEINIF